MNSSVIGRLTWDACKTCRKYEDCEGDFELVPDDVEFDQDAGEIVCNWYESKE